MIRFYLTIATVAGLAAVISRPTKPVVATGAAQSELELLRATERERVRALVVVDLVARRLHATDYQLIDPGGDASSKEQYLGRIASGALDYLVFEPDSIAVRRYAGAAVLRYQARIEVIVRGDRIPLRRYWHTDLYERREGRWQVVWSQATEIQ